uniref:Vacuolar-sorting protein BRO1-like n=1 Tax=Elaeis guineensis var. tenera TaxID=51953 RepID=A0A8N4IGI1_ELAGV|nr:vacuolar-sorting protein BRO1-like [Elaeis guineensis]
MDGQGLTVTRSLGPDTAQPRSSSVLHTYGISGGGERDACGAREEDGGGGPIQPPAAIHRHHLLRARGPDQRGRPPGRPPDALRSREPVLRRDLLQHYFRALALIEPRFPISRDGAHVHFLAFTWHDAFKPYKKVSLPSIHLEKSAVLFDLAVVYSQIALSTDRSSAAGLKQAWHSFQAAAGAFAFVRHHVAAKAVAAGATLDVSPECASMLERLMLAQAQGCFFEKVVTDAKPPGLFSKVAR